MSRAHLTPEQQARGMELLRGEVARLGTKAAVAERIGCKRSAVSQVLAGTYPAQPDGVLAAALATLDRHACPYLGCEVEHSHCVEINAGPAPTWNPPALSQRRACQTCSHKPNGGQP